MIFYANSIHHYGRNQEFSIYKLNSMKRKTMLLLVALVGSTTIAVAQDKTVKGRVTVQADGTVLPGATVRVLGSNRGAITGANGEFTLAAQVGDSLEISGLGFTTQRIAVGNQDQINIRLAENSQLLKETVVTALGITRQAKSLSYAVDKVSNEELTTVRDANVVNSLTGKVAGIQINRSGSGIGGSARVVLRGNKSTRENQPLYVVDGVPMANYTPAQPGDGWGQSIGTSGGLDGGDGISNVNPEDIESMSVLKGAGAAALYGSAAANGVILITTKKGKVGKTTINVSSEVTLDDLLYKAPLQFKYGQTPDPDGKTPGSSTSWGGVVNARDWTSDFFRKGITNFNSLALSSGTEHSQTYFSYSYADNKGIMPNSNESKHNLDFRETAKFLHDRLTADASVSLLSQTMLNLPTSGLYSNPLTGLYEMPRGLNFNTYRDNYEVYSPVRNTTIQNWWNINSDSALLNTGYDGSETQQNPYWIQYRVPHTGRRNRIYANASLSYKLNDWLTLTARGNIDKSIDEIDVRAYATTQQVLSGTNGRYTFRRATNTQLYGDLLLAGNKQLSKSFGLNFTLGGSTTNVTNDQTTFDTNTGGKGLRYANKFGLAYILPTFLSVDQTATRKVQQAAFGTASLSYKGFLYLDLTGRNDWSSTFAYTPVKDHGYFYYSAGLSAVLSDAFKLAEPISFGKVRVSYASVGNDVPAYVTNPSPYTVNNQNGSVINTKGPYPGTYLKPEKNSSFEAGTEWRFLKDRIGFDFTYYANQNKNQYIETQAPSGGSLTTYYLNSGNIKNHGIELSVNATPIKTHLVTWTTGVNYSFNKNEVVSVKNAAIGAQTDYFVLTGIGNLLYGSYIREGGSWGDIYGHFFQRDQAGKIVVDDDGKAQRGTATYTDGFDPSLKKIGNPTPRFLLGWTNSLTVQDFTLSFLIDGRFGGKVMSVTQAVLDYQGNSKQTAAARNAGGVNIDAVTADGSKFAGPIDAMTWYQSVGGQNGISEYYMYDATAIRLRELSLRYNVPLHSKGISSLNISLIGRNLFFFEKKAPFDPELSMSTSNGLQGVETFTLPTTRSMGVSVKVGF
ncbi:TonB-linked outer membrane protein, SusC/RagA family [Chitinophaga costaii]|uniref:TonB-linked outer membrane protein, SusC/RagA family n=2 Tax=Chitinophaga costaii TaxID=1335309 RepID=A0A1C4FND2_9BACT|nr:TonB-linked outer membrane protein, SusC/RagA family [Chitinophaga costaii]